MTPEEFKAWRLSLTWSQDQAAKNLGLNRATVINYEAGRRRETGNPPVVIPKVVELACFALTLFEAAHGNVASDTEFQQKLKTTFGSPSQGELDRFNDMRMKSAVGNIIDSVRAKLPTTHADFIDLNNKRLAEIGQKVQDGTYSRVDGFEADHLEKDTSRRLKLIEEGQ